MTHQLIASPYPEGHVVVRPGYDGAVRIGADRYAELATHLPMLRSLSGSSAQSEPGGAPTWLAV